MKNLNRNAVWMCLFALLGFVGFSFASKVDQIALTPSIDFNQYLASMPYVYLAPLNLYLQQPSSTILVFALGLVTIYVGIVYLRHTSFTTKWLGINFVFWGLGAIFAGISYQAFGADLKCALYESCRFTHWVELFYMTLTVISINALLIAYSAFHSPRTSIRLQILALLSVFMYTLLQGLGMILPVKFLLTYEFMLIFLSINILILMWTDYTQRHIFIHKRLFIWWCVFLVVNLAYFVALFSAYAKPLYQQTGIWFNENDVLHILLLLWMLGWISWINPKMLR
ncbi:MAG: hypothetical protein RBQ97_10255 [Acholeplasma sp.]|nr:hypothetical protein [Acholeplasma sp.]